MKNIFSITFLASSLAVSACATSTTSPTAKAPGTANADTAPKGKTMLSIQSTPSAAAAPMATTAFQASADVTVDTATAVFTSINFKGWEYDNDLSDEDGEDGSDDEKVSPESEDEVEETEESDSEANEDGDGDEDESIEKLDFTGPYFVDLLTGQSVPDLKTIELPSGLYSKVEFKLDAEETESGSKGKSLQFGGSMKVDGVWVKFVLNSSIDHEIKWQFAEPVSISASQVNALVLNMPLGQWLNADLVAALADAYRNGDFTMDANGAAVFVTEDSSLKDVMEKNLEGQGEIDHDHEAEDELDSE